MSDDESDIPSARKAPKISAACDRCRDKKRKCDGKRPSCTYCSGAGHDCQYRGRQKTRGPVAGYLRTLERRVIWLESTIVYIGQNIWNDGATPGHAAYRSMIQSFITAQRSEDNWKSLQNAFKQHYESITTAAQVNVENGPRVAGVKRMREEPSTAEVAAISNVGHDREVDTAAPRSMPPHDGWHSRHSKSLFASTSTALPSAFETMPSSPTDGHFHDRLPRNEQHGRDYDIMDLDSQPHASVTHNPVGTDLDPRFASIWTAQSSHSGGAFRAGFDATLIHSTANIQPLPYPMPLRNEYQPSPIAADTDLLSTSIARQAFDLDYESNLRHGLDSQDAVWSNTIADVPISIQLPPKPIQNSLIQVHLAHIHPILPFLDRNQLTTYMSSESPESIPGHSPPSRILILAICAYSACTSPTLGGLAPHIDSLNEDASAGGSLAEVWAEEVRSTLLSSSLKQRCSIDSVQAMILLVLRDHGKAQNFQSWLWLGIAVRLAQDLGLHHANRKLSLDPESRRHRANIWTTLCFMDVMLSLQLGRPSAVELDVNLKSDDGDTRAFGHLLELCYILQGIRRSINCTPQALSSALDTLRASLHSWKSALPQNLQVMLGEDIPLDVALLLMVYQMAVLLAWRPVDVKQGSLGLRPITLATTAFKFLLDSTQTDGESQPSLLMRCPQAIYAVFTVAITLISTIRQYRSSPDAISAKSYSSILTARVSLLSCTEVIGDVAKLWPLARRCHDILQRLSGEEHSNQSSRPAGSGPLSIPGASLTDVTYVAAGPSINLDFQQRVNSTKTANSFYQNPLVTPFQGFSAGEWGFDEDLYAMLNLDQDN